MKLHVTEFKVTKRYVLRDTHFKTLIKWIFGKAEKPLYHFDAVITVNTTDGVGLLNAMIKLPNNIQMVVRSVAVDPLIYNGFVIKVMTTKFIEQDLTHYQPKEIHLTYGK